MVILGVLFKHILPFVLALLLGTKQFGAQGTIEKGNQTFDSQYERHQEEGIELECQCGECPPHEF